MWQAIRGQFFTLRGRLVLGLAALLGLITAATLIGYFTVERLTEVTSARFASLSESMEIGTELEGLILQQLNAGQQYLQGGDASLEARFAAFGRQAHELRRRYTDLPELTTAELTQIEAVEKLHSRLEVDYALAHALFDVGRRDEALARADSAAPTLEALQTAIRRVNGAQAQKMSAAAAELRAIGKDRQDILLIVLTLAIGVGLWIMLVTMRGVNGPLKQLIGAAQEMGAGNLSVEIRGRMLREFESLAAAFNAMSAQLRTLVLETMSIAEQISNSAFDLSGISEEVAASSGEVATAMVEISRGAESQSFGLQETTRALEEMTQRAQEMAAASAQVSMLSQQIREVAGQSRDEVGQALQMLLEIRGVVQTSEAEVKELEQATSRIDRFVETIAGIARQTNLLALNAAIEAARAGEHGRGFAVVAEEVRKLADGSAGAASEVAELVKEIRAKVGGVMGIMERGLAQGGRRRGRLQDRQLRAAAHRRGHRGRPPRRRRGGELGGGQPGGDRGGGGGPRRRLRHRRVARRQRAGGLRRGRGAVRGHGGDVGLQRPAPPRRGAHEGAGERAEGLGNRESLPPQGTGDRLQGTAGTTEGARASTRCPGPLLAVSCPL